MAQRCEVCGNVESFECAAHKLAPRCAHCGSVVLGHGVEPRVLFLCCASCAGEFGEPGVCDRA